MKISVTDAVSISANVEVVFDFVANLENDALWRKEVNATTMRGQPQLTAVALEDSYLSRRVPNNILTLTCIAYRKDAQVTYQTVPDSRFFLQSDRRVIAVSPNETELTYSIDFNKAIAKHGLGFSLPTFLVRAVAKRNMKKYLTRLKAIIETGDMNRLPAQAYHSRPC